MIGMKDLSPRWAGATVRIRDLGEPWRAGGLGQAPEPCRHLLKHYVTGLFQMTNPDFSDFSPVPPKPTTWVHKSSETESLSRTELCSTQIHMLKSRPTAPWNVAVFGDRIFKEVIEIK